MIEYPDEVKFEGFQIKKIVDKTIAVRKTCIYEFLFENGANIGSRVCEVKIIRIPKDDSTEDFDTSVDWVEKMDTTYEIKTEKIIVGYDTTFKERTRKVLESVDTNVVTITDRIERVHSKTNLNGSNVSRINIQLPDNSYFPTIISPTKKTEVASWAYSIAVGESGKQWYEDSQKKAAAKNTAKIAVSSGFISTGYGALALLAIEGISAFSNPPQGDDVNFNLQTSLNGQSYTIDSGNSVVASGRITDYKQGSFTLVLQNDNFTDGINVDVKVIAVTITENYKKETYTDIEREPIREEQIKKIPKIVKRKIPIMNDSRN